MSSSEQHVKELLNFTQALTIFTFSEDTKKMPVEERQQVIEYIRKTKCPSISYDDWREVATIINDNRKWIVDSLEEYKNQPEEPEPERVQEPESEPVQVQENENASEHDEQTESEEDDDTEPEPDEKKPKRFSLSFNKKQGGKSKTSSLRNMFSKKNAKD